MNKIFFRLQEKALAWKTGSLNPTLVEGVESKLFEAYEALNYQDVTLLTVIEELLINSLEHGKAPIQMFLTRSKSTVLFGIWDEGTGIHQTLPNNPKLADIKGKASAALIRLSLEEHITGTGQVGRGVGLYLASQYVRATKATLLVWSNQAWVFQQKFQFFETPSSENIRGNMILLEVSCA